MAGIAWFALREPNSPQSSIHDPFDSATFADQTTPQSDETRKSERHVQALFSPGDDCLAAIVEEIRRARKSIHVQAYALNSSAVAKALRDAHQRGVECEVILDESQKKATASKLQFLREHKIPTFIDGKHSIAHNKVIIIDNNTAISGSLDFSKKAQKKNAENVIILHGYYGLAKEYEDNYQRCKSHSDRYKARDLASASPRAPPRKSSKPKAEPRSRTNPRTDPDDPVVYITRTGSKYHQGTCSYLRKSRIPTRLSQCGGHGPCSRCRPPVFRSSTPRDNPPREARDGRCTATTKKGTRCKRNSRSRGRCWQHGG